MDRLGPSESQDTKHRQRDSRPIGHCDRLTDDGKVKRDSYVALYVHGRDLNGQKTEGVGVMKDKEQKLEETNSSHTLVEQVKVVSRGEGRGVKSFLVLDVLPSKSSIFDL